MKNIKISSDVRAAGGDAAKEKKSTTTLLPKTPWSRLQKKFFSAEKELEILVDYLRKHTTVLTDCRTNGLRSLSRRVVVNDVITGKKRSTIHFCETKNSKYLVHFFIGHGYQVFPYDTKGLDVVKEATFEVFYKGRTFFEQRDKRDLTFDLIEKHLSIVTFLSAKFESLCERKFHFKQFSKNQELLDAEIEKVVKCICLALDRSETV